MNSKIKIIAIVLLIILVAVGAYFYHDHQKSENEIQRAKIGMMNMTIEVMNREIHSPGNKERKLLHRVKDIKFIRTVNNKEAKIKFNKSEDKTIIEKL